LALFEYRPQPFNPLHPRKSHLHTPSYLAPHKLSQFFFFWRAPPTTITRRPPLPSQPDHQISPPPPPYRATQGLPFCRTLPPPPSPTSFPTFTNITNLRSLLSSPPKPKKPTEYKIPTLPRKAQTPLQLFSTLCDIVPYTPASLFFWGFFLLGCFAFSHAPFAPNFPGSMPYDCLPLSACPYLSSAAQHPSSPAECRSFGFDSCRICCSYCGLRW